MLFLIIPATIQLVIIFYLLIKNIGWKEFFSFVGFGLLFGFIRSNIINLIQIKINHSVIPYEFAGKLLRIGNDSLVVYFGWITTAFIAWQISKIFLEKYDINLKDQIFPLISFSFIFIMAFSYMTETAASFAGWWHWNNFLESGFQTSVFVNVPWVGIVDWGTVAFEFLGLFIIGRYIFQKKDWRPAIFLSLPLVHWLSHLNSVGSIALLNSQLKLTIFIHLLLPVIAVILFFVRGFKQTEQEKNELPENSIIFVLSITYFVALAVGIIYARNITFLISLIPVSLIVLYLKMKNRVLLLLVAALLLSFSVILNSPLDSTRFIFAFFPLAYITLISLLEKANFQKILRPLAIPTFVIFAGLFIFSFPSSATKTFKNIGSTKSNDRNIVLISIDTLRADHLSQNGYFRDTSPNLDKIAREGTKTSIYAPVPYTLPAHFSMLSGIHPYLANVTTNSSLFDSTGKTPFISSVLKDQGYNTAAFISSSILDKGGLKNGFDEFNFTASRPTFDGTNNEDPITERSSKDTLLLANQWIFKNKDNPYFVWIHLFDPHSPYRNYCNYYDYSKGLEPKDDLFKDGEVQKFYKIKNDIKQIPDEDYRYLEALYDEEIKCVDANLGSFFEQLKQENLYDKTDLIIVGDHGENFDHNSLFHGHNLYEGALKVPLIAKSQDKGDVADNTSLLDLFNLIERYTGLSKEKSQKDKDIFFATKDNIIINKDTNELNTTDRYGIKSGNYKFLFSNQEQELYDLTENENDQKDNQIISNSLYLKLKDFFKI
jgi:arylsulfatase A-like enzyme